MSREVVTDTEQLIRVLIGFPRELPRKVETVDLLNLGIKRCPNANRRTELLGEEQRGTSNGKLLDIYEGMWSAKGEAIVIYW